MTVVNYRNHQQPSPAIQAGMALALKFAANVSHGELGQQVGKGPWINPCPNFLAYVGSTVVDFKDVEIQSIMVEITSDLALMLDSLYYSDRPTSQATTRRIIKNGYTIRFTENVLYNRDGSTRSNMLIYRLSGDGWVIYYNFIGTTDDERGEKMSVEYKEVFDVVFEGDEENFLNDLFMYRISI